MFLWSAQLYQEADLVMPDGKRVHYVRTSPGGSYIDAVFEHTTTPGAFYKSVITWNGDGWDLRLRDGTTYVFGDMKPLQEIRDRFGNTLRVTWDVPDQTITKVTSPSGRYLAFAYDTSNRITEVQDNIGRTVEYEYDASGRLWKVTDARGGVTECTPRRSCELSSFGRRLRRYTVSAAIIGRTHE
jgi:YD repeat-containing protein